MAHTVNVCLVTIKYKNPSFTNITVPQKYIFDLKVPKCEILDRSDFHYFYTIKPFWVDDFVVKILTFYFNFWGESSLIYFLMRKLSIRVRS
jgi:hypothetical protein